MHRWNSATQLVLAGSLLIHEALPVCAPDSDKESFVYPEQSDTDWGIQTLKDKPNFGVAVSGGGYRATNTTTQQDTNLADPSTFWEAQIAD